MEENRKQEEKVTETAPMPAANQGEQPTAELHPQSHEEENVAAAESKQPKVAKMQTAEKRITKHLAKQSIAPQEGSIRTALIALYERYELHNTVPTQSAFAEACQDKQAGASVLEMEKDPFRPTGKRNALIAAGCTAVAIAAVAAGFALYNGNAAQQKPQIENKPAVAEVKKAVDTSVHAKVTCDGWDEETSTPIVLSVYQGDVKDAITSTDENTELADPILEKQVKAGEDTVISEITEPGTYTFAIVGSPVLSDGTIFNLPEPQVIEYTGEEGIAVEMELTAKAAEQVTEADIAAAQATAIAVGADGNKVTSNINTTSNNAKSAQGGNIQQGSTGAAAKDTANKTGTTIPSGNNNQGGNSGSTTGGNTSGSTGGNSGSTTPSTPTHQHNWVPQTTTVHHDAVYKTETSYIHHDAIVQDVYVCLCGAEFSNSSDLSAHQKQYRLQGISGHGSSSVKEKVIKNAYDEPVTKQVLVSNAYDETVTTGYKCSTCGAPKSN